MISYFYIQANSDDGIKALKKLALIPKGRGIEPEQMFSVPLTYKFNVTNPLIEKTLTPSDILIYFSNELKKMRCLLGKDYFIFFKEQDLLPEAKK